MPHIEILGFDSPNFSLLETNLRSALAELGVDQENYQRETDPFIVLSHVCATPAIIVGDNIIYRGVPVPSPERITELLRPYLQIMNN